MLLASRFDGIKRTTYISFERNALLVRPSQFATPIFPASLRVSADAPEEARRRNAEKSKAAAKARVRAEACIGEPSSAQHIWYDTCNVVMRSDNFIGHHPTSRQSL